MQQSSFVIRTETIALLMNDPLLPAPFVNESARNQFAQDVQQLDAIGQKLWKKIYEQELIYSHRFIFTNKYFTF
jgi:phenylacetic acid degradation operon negative regulatory protein